jgi:hypothetical protein
MPNFSLQDLINELLGEAHVRNRRIAGPHVGRLVEY